MHLKQLVFWSIEHSPHDIFSYISTLLSCLSFRCFFFTSSPEYKHSMQRFRHKLPKWLNYKQPCNWLIDSVSQSAFSSSGGLKPPDPILNLIQVITAWSHSKSCPGYNGLIPFKILSELKPPNLVMVLHSGGQSGGASWWRVWYQRGYTV